MSKDIKRKSNLDLQNDPSNKLTSQEHLVNKVLLEYQLDKTDAFKNEVAGEDVLKLLGKLNISLKDVNLNAFLYGDRNNIPGTEVHLESISFQQFRILVNNLKLYDVFTQLDEDNSGFIDETEIGMAMRKLGYKVNDKRCKMMMKQLDTNGDGVISFDEFERFFSSFPHESYEKIIAAWMEATDTTDCGGDITPIMPTLGLKWWQTVIAGGTAGVLARTLTAPLEKVKIAAQTGRATIPGGGIFQELRSVYRIGGIQSMFAGNAVNCIRVFPTAGITCTCYLNLLSLTPADDEFDKYEPFYRMGCGGAAALIANTLTYPLDVVRAKLTVVNGSEGKLSIVQCFKNIIEEGGTHALYRGLRPTLLAVVPFIAVQNATIDILRDIAIQDGYTASPGLLFGVGAIAGIAAQTIVYPLDVLRRRIQLSSASVVGTGKSSASRTVLSDNTWIALKQTINQHGFKSLFSGIVPTFMKTLPTVAVVALVTGSINSYFKKANKMNQ